MGSSSFGFHWSETTKHIFIMVVKLLALSSLIYAAAAQSQYGGSSGFGGGAGGNGGFGGSGGGFGGAAGGFDDPAGGGAGSLEEAIPGVPGDDYPILAEVPETSFFCDGQADGGYYADPEAECQVFHICANDGNGGLTKYSFLCPNGTLFQQQYFVCDWWFNVDCSLAEQLYSLNEENAAERDANSPPGTAGGAGGYEGGEGGRSGGQQGGRGSSGSRGATGGRRGGSSKSGSGSQGSASSLRGSYASPSGSNDAGFAGSQGFNDLSGSGADTGYAAPLRGYEGRRRNSRDTDTEESEEEA